MINNQQILLKISYEDKIKRAILAKTYQELNDIITRSFCLNSFKIFYEDEEKDLILIESQYDYDNAIIFLKQNGGNNLKVIIKNEEKRKVVEQNFPTTNLILSLNSEAYVYQNCNRKFSNQHSHQKHYDNCVQVFKSERPKFNSNKQRLRDFLINVPEDNKKCQKLRDLFMDYKNFKMKNAFENWRSKGVKHDTNNIRKREIIIPPIKIPFCSNFKLSLITCKGCHRSFDKIPYIKHIKICSILNKKRKSFDSRKQRIINEEHAHHIKKLDLLKNIENKEKISIVKSRWKKQSERLRTIIRITRMLYKIK